ncbi:MAG: hypothetical protein KDC38_09685 [Planctomycetes bacterium]|nr:hypothetical protein [Planctomycetota bacterium]
MALTLGTLAALIAGDVQRRRVQLRRRWYERRLHTAMDRVHSLKQEMEPELDGVRGFVHIASRSPSSAFGGGTGEAPDTEPESSQDVAPSPAEVEPSVV